MIQAAREVRLRFFADGTYGVYIEGKHFPYLLTEFPAWEQINGSGVYELTLKFLTNGIVQENHRG